MAAGNQAYIARYVARLKVLINKTQLIDLLFRLPLIYFTPVDKIFLICLSDMFLDQNQTRTMISN